MTKLETPELRWGNRDYPYHQTGEVQASEYFNRLHPVNRSYLMFLLQHLLSVARAMRTPLSTLAVGSSADILWPEYNDIDLVVCPDKPTVRTDFVEAVFQQIVHNPNFYVMRESPKGSAPVLTTHQALYTPFKLFAFPNLRGEMVKYAKQFDMTFVGTEGGSTKEVIEFHRSNHLAFCKLEIV
ncbi:hypothetical protein A2363_00515 [Candidatus Gottesmanbacteria bacterium RIFOXYB1_FULL_47_11]|uniref:Uncharacterized protein n=1 Tax=Candidatus Gottesmanbacteria bacterium RIFOXYB1_FULL_47_11 TaxID=1798401 RepID=A0A1F6BBZ4_9BACT|nr:MAG: hypothetical protein A2363_00515 [Candidatus Gottesmanbacteria bacterium RIFOXYB1_FULL_47_11]